jgi:hypothetical protein
MRVSVYRVVMEEVWRDISSVFDRRSGDVAGITSMTISLRRPDVKETCGFWRKFDIAGELIERNFWLIV